MATFTPKPACVSGLLHYLLITYLLALSTYQLTEVLKCLPCFNFLSSIVTQPVIRWLRSHHTLRYQFQSFPHHFESHEVRPVYKPWWSSATRRSTENRRRYCGSECVWPRLTWYSPPAPCRGETTVREGQDVSFTYSGDGVAYSVKYIWSIAWLPEGVIGQCHLETLYGWSSTASVLERRYTVLWMLWNSKRSPIASAWVRFQWMTPTGLFLRFQTR